VYGITSVLRYSQFLSTGYIGQIHEYLLEKASENLSESQLEKLQNLINSNNVGLLINERYVNLPPALVPTLLGAIPEDIKFTMAQDDVASPEEYNYEYYLYFTK
jgi:protein BCP1